MPPPPPLPLPLRQEPPMLTVTAIRIAIAPYTLTILHLLPLPPPVQPILPRTRSGKVARVIIPASSIIPAILTASTSALSGWVSNVLCWCQKALMLGLRSRLITPITTGRTSIRNVYAGKVAVGSRIVQRKGKGR